MDNRSRLLCGAAIVIVIGFSIFGLGIFILANPEVLWSIQPEQNSNASKENPSILIGKTN